MEEYEYRYKTEVNANMNIVTRLSCPFSLGSCNLSSTRRYRSCFSVGYYSVFSAARSSCNLSSAARYTFARYNVIDKDLSCGTETETKRNSNSVLNRTAKSSRRLYSRYCKSSCHICSRNFSHSSADIRSRSFNNKNNINNSNTNCNTNTNSNKNENFRQQEVGKNGENGENGKMKLKNGEEDGEDLDNGGTNDLFAETAEAKLFGFKKENHFMLRDRYHRRTIQELEDSVVRSGKNNNYNNPGAAGSGSAECTAGGSAAEFDTEETHHTKNAEFEDIKGNQNAEFEDKDNSNKRGQYYKAGAGVEQSFVADRLIGEGRGMMTGKGGIKLSDGITNFDSSNNAFTTTRGNLRYTNTRALPLHFPKEGLCIFKNYEEAQDYREACHTVKKQTYMSALMTLIGYSCVSYSMASIMGVGLGVGLLPTSLANFNVTNFAIMLVGSVGVFQSGLMVKSIQKILAVCYDINLIIIIIILLFYYYYLLYYHCYYYIFIIIINRQTTTSGIYILVLVSIDSK